MWRNYFITALRNIQKQPFYAFVNVFGLAVGLTAVILMFLFINDELKYDTYHPDSERTYRALNGQDQPSPLILGVFFKYIKTNLSGVENITIVFPNRYTLNCDGQLFGQQKVIAVDSNFFDIFSWKAAQGNIHKALRTNKAVILTKSAAMKYFGTEYPLGKSLLIQNRYEGVVTAVIEDIPTHSHFHCDVITGLHLTEELNASALTHWGNASFHMYMKLFPNAEPQQVAQQITDIYEKDAVEKYTKLDFLRLQPLEDIHLHSSNVRFEISPQGNITTVRIFGISAVLILLLACVNFINLSTARASQRFKEVGLRKVIGSNKFDLIKQFLVETSFYVMIAVVFALVFAELIIPWFSQLANKEFSLHIFLDPVLFCSTLLFIIVLTLFSGLYPSFILSSYTPVVILKGVNYSKQGVKRFGLREALVVFQFIISVALLAGSLIVQQQLNFIHHTNLGYNKSHRIVISNPWDDHMDIRFDALKNKLTQIPQIIETSGSHNIPNRMQNNYSTFQIKGTESEQYMHGAVISVENNFFSQMNTQLIAGQSFPKSLSDRAKDSLDICIINECAYKTLQQYFGVDPLGKVLTGFWDDLKTRKIVGVVEDVHFRSLHDPVIPAVFLVSKSRYPNYNLNLIVNYHEDSKEEVVKILEKNWASLAPEWPINYQFLDQEFDSLYKQEANMSVVMQAFTFVALLISCLGLIALSLLVLQSRIKQIGIRKVLGATEQQLLQMYIWRFVKLVLIANVMALPLMWFIANEWLSTFAYRTKVSIFLLFAVGGVSLIISIIVVYYQTMKTARANPIESLRYE